MSLKELFMKKLTPEEIEAKLRVGGEVREFTIEDRDEIAKAALLDVQTNGFLNDAIATADMSAVRGATYLQKRVNR